MGHKKRGTSRPCAETRQSPKLRRVPPPIHTPIHLHAITTTTITTTAMARLSNSAPAAGTKRPRRVSNTLTFTTAQPHPPAKKQKKAPTTTTRAAATKKPSPWYTARAILDEDACRYLIDWEAGDDGTLFAATWEPKRNANAALVKEWKDDKRSEAKGKPKGRKEKATKPAAAVDAGVSSAKTEETEAAADAGVASTKKGKARKRAVPKSSTVQAPAVQEPAKADPAVFSVREIVAERKGVYRVAWEPDATTGEVYEDTWEPKGHVSQDLVQAWKKTRKERMQQNKQRKEQQGRQQEGQTQQQEQELPLSR